MVVEPFGARNIMSSQHIISYNLFIQLVLADVAGDLSIVLGESMFVTPSTFVLISE